MAIGRRQLKLVTRDASFSTAVARRDPGSRAGRGAVTDVAAGVHAAHDRARKVARDDILAVGGIVGTGGGRGEGLRLRL